MILVLSLCVLGILPDKRMDGDVTYSLRMMLLIAKKYIPVCLLRPQLPNIMHLRDEVKQVFTVETITARLQLNVQRFTKTWWPLIQAMPDL